VPDSIAAIVPVFVLILFGWGLRKAKFAPEVFWTGVDRLTYFILLPCLLVNGLATANLDGVPLGDAVLVVTVSVLIVVGLIYYLRNAIAPKPGTLGALIQCSIRGNNYPVLAIVLALFDDLGLAAFALTLIAFVPLTNLISVIALVRTTKTGADRPNSLWLVVRQVVLNPILIAVAIGLTLNLADTGLPAPAGDILQILGRAALPGCRRRPGLQCPVRPLAGGSGVAGVQAAAAAGLRADRAEQSGDRGGVCYGAAGQCGGAVFGLDLRVRAPDERRRQGNSRHDRCANDGERHNAAAVAVDHGLVPVAATKKGGLHEAALAVVRKSPSTSSSRTGSYTGRPMALSSERCPG